MTLISISIQSKGGPGSGNWGHRGIPGKVGGSSPRGAGLSPTSGKDWLQRYEKRAGKKHPKAMEGPVRRGGTPGKGHVDPLADAFLRHGSSSKGTWKFADNNAVAATKSKITGLLASASGVDRSAVNYMVGKWADTSNDHDAEALSMQEAVSEEFGVPLSDWQKDNISRVNSDPATFGGPVKGYVSREDERKVLRAMYDNTQAELKTAGFEPGDTVTLFRGTTSERVTGRRTWDVEDYKGNAIESWSISKGAAKDFADGYGTGSQGSVLSMNVPIENIIGTAVTGFGCVNEGEFVVLGSVPSEVSIAYVT